MPDGKTIHWVLIRLTSVGALWLLCGLTSAPLVTPASAQSPGSPTPEVATPTPTAALTLTLTATVAPTNTLASTPTSSPDATLATLQQARVAAETTKLTLEGKRLEIEQGPFGPLLLTYPTVIVPFIALLVPAIVAGIGVWQWFGNQRQERAKRDEERFQRLVIQLTGEADLARFGAAAGLRTFTDSQYDQYHRPLFDAVVYVLRAYRPSSGYSAAPSALVDLFRNAVVPARAGAWRDAPKDLLQRYHTSLKSDDQVIAAAIDNTALLSARDIIGRHLDASGVWLVEAELFRAQLALISLREANCREARLIQADLRWAILNDADLSRADLSAARLGRADLRRTILRRATLSDANLVDARAPGADLRDADLTNAVLSGLSLHDAKLERAILVGADFRRIRPSNPPFAGPEVAASLEGANLYGVRGLTRAQLHRCRELGARWLPSAPPTLSHSWSDDRTSLIASGRRFQEGDVVTWSFGLPGQTPIAVSGNPQNVDSNGDVELTLLVPPDLPNGTYVLEVMGVETDLMASVAVALPVQ